MNLKKLSAEYDRIYKEADKIFRECNPCQFKGGRCTGNRRNINEARDHTPKNGCCGRVCGHLSPKGCVVKTLGCKLYVCSFIYTKKNRKFCTKIDALRKEAVEILGHFVTHCFVTKKEFFNEDPAPLSILGP